MNKELPTGSMVDLTLSLAQANAVLYRVGRGLQNEALQKRVERNLRTYSNHHPDGEDEIYTELVEEVAVYTPSVGMTAGGLITFDKSNNLTLATILTAAVAGAAGLKWKRIVDLNLTRVLRYVNANLEGVTVNLSACYEAMEARQDMVEALLDLQYEYPGVLGIDNSALRENKVEFRQYVEGLIHSLYRDSASGICRLPERLFPKSPLSPIMTFRYCLDRVSKEAIASKIYSERAPDQRSKYNLLAEEVCGYQWNKEASAADFGQAAIEFVNYITNFVYGPKLASEAQSVVPTPDPAPCVSADLTQAPVEQLVLINGRPDKAWSDNEIFGMIGRLEQEAEEISKVKNLPKSARAKLQEIERHIASLVEYVDGREG